MDGRRCLIWFWGSPGGGADTAYRLAQALSETQGAGAISLCVRSDFPQLSAARAAGHRTFTIEGTSGVRRPIRTALSIFERARSLRHALKVVRPETVLVAMNFALAYPLCQLVRHSGARLVYVAHDPSPHSGDYAPTWQKWSQRQLMREANQVVALSGYAADLIGRLGMPHQGAAVHVAPLGGLYRPRTDGPRALDATQPLRFLALGRLIAYKGLDLLAQAARSLAGRQDWRLTIAGDGPLRTQVRDLFSGMAQVDVNRIGWLSEADISTLIDTHDILICPYTDATQSGVICEALSAAMPCIVTPVGALAEQIGHGLAGFVTASATGAQVFEAMVRVLDDRSTYAAVSEGCLTQLSADRLRSNWAGVAFGAPPRAERGPEEPAAMP